NVGPHGLGEEAAPQDAANGAPRMVGAAGDEEAGVQPAALERARQRRDAVAQADVRIDVDLQRQQAIGSGYSTGVGRNPIRRSHSARRAARPPAARLPRNQSTVLRRPSASGVSARTPSTRSIFVTS